MVAPIVEATRTGPWTADEVLALGEDRELGSTHEVVDGSLLLSPSPNYDHQRIARRLSFALEDGLLAGYEAFDGGNVRIDHDTLLIPDVVVLRRPKPRLVAATPADVLLVVEIVSPSTRRTDRTLKPVVYAEAGIPWFVLVEPECPDAPVVVVHELVDGAYVERVRAAAGQRLRLTEPFAIDLDPAELTRRR
jgi:Uma2 family endonuclease